ncbi:MAG: GNAT family N-acetyltransferase [candidate division SR1 bacterium]|nr:GNAT family N-acetyltransferase [candidate division SR1 bacterium]
MKISLPTGLQLDKKISLKEYQQMKILMKQHDIGRYKLKQKDFYRVRDKDQIIAFGRLHEIGEHQLELGSVWVHKKYRGRKIGLFICQELIKDKKAENEVFLATRNILRLYYQKLGFKIIKKDIPIKLQYTIKRAIKEGIEFIIMKLK